MPAPPDRQAAINPEDTLAAVIESTPDPFIIVNADGTIGRVNRQAERFFGYAREELIGRSYKMLIPERFRERHDGYASQYRKQPEMREMGSGLELWCLPRSGGEIPVEIGLSPVVTGGETTVMVRFRDIRKEKEEEAILREAVAKADEANRTKTRFLAAASHDLRQPLQSISMYLGALAGVLGAAERKQVIDKARMAVDATNKLLNALLNITKLESGRVEPEIESFAIDTLLQRVHNTEAPLAGEKHQKFVMVGSSATVESDPALLEQLVNNLAANAVKYTPPHGHILMGCRRKGSRLMIQVCDNGPGIDSSELDLIFDEYRQLEYDGHYLGKGLGLGLSIVKLIAELLDLKLEVKSTPGKGTCFNVYVPLSKAKPVRRQTPHAAVETPGDIGGRILLIDDDAAVLDSTRMFLELSGYTVVTAENSAPALTAVAAWTPDIIITDYGLGERENGIILLGRLRSAIGRDVPAIVVTGDTSDMRIQDAKDIGCTLMRKPVDVQTLLRQVSTLLSAA